MLGVVYSKLKLEQKDTFGNSHTKVLVSHVGYFERKVNEANSEEELRDKSGDPHAAPCKKVVK